jgi:beta-xylosidase
MAFLTSPKPAGRRYRNPVYDGYFADPFVLRAGQRYLAYGTGSIVDGLVFEVLESADLVSWRRIGGALQPLPPQMGSDYWAPEIAYAEGRYWMYYSVGFGDRHHHVRVAVGERSTIGAISSNGTANTS